MDDFQKYMARLRKNPAFVAVYDKRRVQAEVAFQIRRLREGRGWTQVDLARRVGCTQQAISAIEQAGYTRHSLPLLRRIAEALDADLLHPSFTDAKLRLYYICLCSLLKEFEPEIATATITTLSGVAKH